MLPAKAVIPQNDPAGESRPDFVLGDWHVQSRLDRIARQGESHHLEPKLMDLLVYLSQHPGAVLSKDELLEKVWAKQFVGESTLSRAIAELRRLLGDDAQTPRYIETIPRRGYRLIAPVTTGPPAVAPAADPAATTGVPRTRWRSGVGVALIAALGIFALGLVLYARAAAPALSDKDVVLIADFENTTGDPLFDDTLKQAFVIGIEQSPYFSLFPAERIRSTLEMMKRSPDERVTPALAREICERNGIAAMLVGSLAPLGSSYVITLQAISARSGETLAREQAQASNSEEILLALGSAASKLRRRLGESRASIERFDKPLVEVTTSSLEALRFYTEGTRLARADAIPFYLKAVELDPAFARAHFSLAGAYLWTGNRAAATPAFLRAIELRDRVTERDRYYLNHTHLLDWEGDPLAARQNMELAVQAYPRHVRFRTMLAASYRREGRHAEAVEQAAEGIRLAPGTQEPPPYFLHAAALQALGRYEEARHSVAEAAMRWPDDGDAHAILLSIGFAEGDRTAIRRELDWWRDKDPSGFAFFTARMGLFEGRRFQQAVAAVSDADGLAYLAADSAALGDCDGARALLRGIPGDIDSWTHSGGSVQAVAFALCGDLADARQILTRIEKDPHAMRGSERVIQLPLAEATLEQSTGNFTLARAKLEPALAFQLGDPAGFWTTYVLGLGYLGERRPTEARAAFEKILGHRSVDPTSPLYPLSYLGLARASKLSGDTARARRAYEDLFAIWKDADPDLPALVAAREEYDD